MEMIKITGTVKNREHGFFVIMLSDEMFSYKKDTYLVTKEILKELKKKGVKFERIPILKAKQK